MIEHTPREQELLAADKRILSDAGTVKVTPIKPAVFAPWLAHLEELRAAGDPRADLVAAQLQAQAPPLTGAAGDADWLPGAEAWLDALADAGIHSTVHLSTWSKKDLTALPGLNRDAVKQLAALAETHGAGLKPSASAGQKLFRQAVERYGWNRAFLKRNGVEGSLLYWRLGYVVSLTVGTDRLDILSDPACRLVRKLRVRAQGMIPQFETVFASGLPLQQLSVVAGMLSFDLAECARAFPDLVRLEVSQGAQCLRAPLLSPSLKVLEMMPDKQLPLSTIEQLCGSRLPALRDLRLGALGDAGARLLLEHASRFALKKVHLVGSFEAETSAALREHFGKRLKLQDDATLTPSRLLKYPELDAQRPDLDPADLVGTWVLEDCLAWSDHTHVHRSQYDNDTLELSADGSFRLEMAAGPVRGTWRTDGWKFVAEPGDGAADQDLKWLRHSDGRLYTFVVDGEHAIEVKHSFRRA